MKRTARWHWEEIFVHDSSENERRCFLRVHRSNPVCFCIVTIETLTSDNPSRTMCHICLFRRMSCQGIWSHHNFWFISQVNMTLNRPAFCLLTLAIYSMLSILYFVIQISTHVCGLIIMLRTVSYHIKTFSWWFIKTTNDRYWTIGMWLFWLFWLDWIGLDSMDNGWLADYDLQCHWILATNSNRRSKVNQRKESPFPSYKRLLKWNESIDCTEKSITHISRINRRNCVPTWKRWFTILWGVWMHDNFLLHSECPRFPTSGNPHSTPQFLNHQIIDFKYSQICKQTRFWIQTSFNNLTKVTFSEFVIVFNWKILAIFNLVFSSVAVTSVPKLLRD
jgi:hypothetical protein